MEGNPTEEVMDILGFLAFEFIKQLITSSKFQKSQKIKLENVIDSVVLEVGVVEKGKGKAVKSKLHFNRSISALPLPLITPISLFSPSTSSSITLTTSTGLSKSDSINSLEILQSLESLQQIQLKKKEFGFNKFGKGKRKRENGLI